MGCTSSNQSTNAKQSSTPIPRSATDDGQQLIPDHFRKWLKSNRPKADEYVLNDVLSTAPVTNEAEDYRNIVGKALDLLADRHDIKSTNKLGKIIQKEICLASPRKVAHTVSILQQAAQKLRDGELQLDPDSVLATSDAAIVDNQQGKDETVTNIDGKENQPTSSEPGIPLKDALDKARILFYKGKQAAIFANPRGGYDVRVIAENDEAIHQDGNLLRSIIVTEVKMKPKGNVLSRTNNNSAPLFIPPPPPTTAPPPNLVDENELSDEFRRSIDDALRGLEAVYQPTPVNVDSRENVQKIDVDRTVGLTRASSPPPLKVIQCGVTNAPIVKSPSKDQKLEEKEIDKNPDNTKNLAEIMRQMAEQQKLIRERSANNETNEPNDSVNEIMMESIEVVADSELGGPMSSLSNETIVKLVPPLALDETEGEIERMVREMKEHGENVQQRENIAPTIPTSKQPSSYSIGLTSPMESQSSTTSAVTRTKKSKLRTENRPKSFIANEEIVKKDRLQLSKQISLDELASLTRTGLSNPTLPTSSTTKLGISTSSGKIDEEDQNLADGREMLTKTATSISQILEEHHPLLDETIQSSTSTAPTPNVLPLETNNVTVRSPLHNVTYTEIIHSESHDGEQSRRFITESYNEHPSTEDEQTTTLKVVTKSEFTNHPTTGEKIMEQSVQVITVKVRNETIKTTIQQASIPIIPHDNEGVYERRTVSELVKNFEIVAGTSNQNGSSS